MLCAASYMTETEQDRLVDLFWDGFEVPTLQSQRGLELYYDWVETEDWIAGPIYTIANGGTWDRLFADDEGPLAKVRNVAALLAWYNKPIELFRQRVDDYRPRSAAGQADKETLLRKVAILRELGYLAATIHSARSEVP